MSHTVTTPSPLSANLGPALEHGAHAGGPVIPNSEGTVLERTSLVLNDCAERCHYCDGPETD